jgi:hypothetical protein
MELNENLVAYCGLYCGACPIYLKGKCKSCKDPNSDVHYKSCKVRPCCTKNEYSTCAECNKYQSIDYCKDYNPLFLRFSQFLTQTSRKKGIEKIKNDGAKAFLEFMANRKWFNMKRKG